MQQFSHFKKTVKYWQSYDLKQFYNPEKDMYKFDFYSVGVDWAIGHKDHTVFMVVCLKNIIILVIMMHILFVN